TAITWPSSRTRPAAYPAPHSDWSWRAEATHLGCTTLGLASGCAISTRKLPPTAQPRSSSRASAPRSLASVANRPNREEEAHGRLDPRAPHGRPAVRPAAARLRGKGLRPPPRLLRAGRAAPAAGR